jgi:hypothetical protein
MSPTTSDFGSDEDDYDDDDESYDDDDVYALDLYDRTSTCSEILDKIRGHATFISFRKYAAAGYSTLKVEEVDAALDVNVVQWDDFHTKVLESVAENRGTNKTNVSRKSITHMKMCTNLKAALSQNEVQFVNTTEEVQKGNDWRSVVQTCACLFIEELERSANKAADDLSTRIDEILATPWKPLNDVHEETIYYIVGAFLDAAKRKLDDKRTTDSLRTSLQALIRLQSMSKEDAIAAGAPTRRVANREAVSLNYASNDFYKVVCKYESVFRSLLNDDDIRMQGEGLLRSVSNLLSKKDVGLQDLLGLGAFVDESDAREVSAFLLNYYTGLRGKDFARKRNAQVVRTGETHRATLGVIHEIAKTEHKKKREGGEGTSRPAKGSRRQAVGGGGAMEATDSNDEDEGGDDDEEEEEGEESPSMKMLRAQLVALCRGYGLATSGKKAKLLQRLREHTQKRSETDHAEELAEEGLREGEMEAVKADYAEKYGEEDDDEDDNDVNENDNENKAGDE